MNTTTEIGSGVLQFKLLLRLFIPICSVDQEYEKRDPKVLKKCSNNKLPSTVTADLPLWNDFLFSFLKLFLNLQHCYTITYPEPSKILEKKQKLKTMYLVGLLLRKHS